MSYKNQKKSSEWVGAPGTASLCERKHDSVQETFTPTARDIRAMRRAKIAEEQARVENNITGMVIGSDLMMEPLCESHDSTAHVISDSKLHSFIQLEQHHRVLQPSLSLESGLENETLTSHNDFLHHENRFCSSPCKGFEMKKKINFPAANDSVWGKINSELESLIAVNFTDNMINNLSISVLSQKFDSWLHEYFLGIFGEKTAKVHCNKFRKPRESKSLALFCEKKKACKKAFKALQREGKEKSPEGISLSQEFKSLMRQHNKLRKQLLRKKSQVKRLSSEFLFKKDPNGYAQKLFQKTAKSQSPTFSAEIAEDYFKRTYQDTDRSHRYFPLPEMERPNMPDHIFSLRCPTLKETLKSIRRKRNGAAPGLNSLPYVPYKKCSALVKFVVKLGQKIWKSRKIPDDWACAYIVLLSKSDSLDAISEFRPIAITSTVGNFFSQCYLSGCRILCSRTVSFQENFKKDFYLALQAVLNMSLLLWRL